MLLKEEAINIKEGLNPERLNEVFDSLSHDPLIAKLNAYRFNMSALRFVHSYLKNHMQRTKINSEYSSWEYILFGVPRGSILGPLLFNIFLCDIFLIMENIDITSYADDNTPYTTVNSIEEVIQKLCCKNTLSVV